MASDSWSVYKKALQIYRIDERGVSGDFKAVALNGNDPQAYDLSPQTLEESEQWAEKVLRGEIRLEQLPLIIYSEPEEVRSYLEAERDRYKRLEE